MDADQMDADQMGADETADGDVSQSGDFYNQPTFDQSSPEMPDLYKEYSNQEINNTFDVPNKSIDTTVSSVTPDSNTSSPSIYENSPTPEDSPEKQNIGGTRRRKGRKGRTKRKRNKKQ